MSKIWLLFRHIVMVLQKFGNLIQEWEKTKKQLAIDTHYDEYDQIRFSTTISNTSMNFFGRRFQLCNSHCYWKESADS